MHDDIQLVKKCQSGDLEKFGLLYDKYIKKIYDFVYFKTMHKETAEDIVSQVFFKALNGINNFKTGQGTFSAWLYRIARNQVIDHYRTKKTETDIDSIWDLSSHEDAEIDFDNKSKLEQVEEYLKTLKSEQREIVIMRVWQDMPYSEIAEALGKSEAGCKMAYSRAIHKLRQEIPLAIYILLLWNA